MEKHKNNGQNRWFKVLKSIMRLFVRETKFIYIGNEITEPTIILSNHVGTSAPLAWELYNSIPFRFWGSSEMNSGLVKLYKYQSRIFYHEKKHWNLFLARLFCIIASPLTYMFYRGINLISTYKDILFKKTISESIETIKNGQSIVIFPEISDKGYLDVLEGFHCGFTVLGSILLKKCIDAQITVAYYRKSEKVYVVDNPLRLSEVFTEGATREEIAARLCDRCNELGKMNIHSQNSETVSV